jgi:drug/metabolite transporter (DMT)-like permease
MAVAILGILSMLTGAAINNLGIVLQKRQVNLRSGRGDKRQVSDIGLFLRDPVWVLGIVMQTLLIWPFFLYALDTIGVTLAQPLSNSGIIVLVLGLVYFLGEKLKRTEALGVVLLVLSMISIGLGGVSGDITQQSVLNPESSMQLGYLVMCVLVLSAILAALSAIVFRVQIVTLGLLSGSCYAIVSISMQVFIVSLEDLSQIPAVLMFTLGLVGTVLGTVFGILTTQEAFKRGRGVNIIPFMQITMNLIPIAAGLWVFGQVLSQPLFFWLGAACIIIAASMLARFQEQ